LTDYFANEWKITFETIRTENSSSAPTDERNSSSPSPNEAINEPNVQANQDTGHSSGGIQALVKTQYSNNSKYEQEFEEIQSLGSGSFGKVYKVRYRFDEEIYAVKKIDLKGISFNFMKF